MSGAPPPPALLEPIASSAADGTDPGDKTNPMPDVPTGGNAASVRGGFPAITMESELAGGLPPLGQDMNGFLYLLSSHTMFLQCGQFYTYNSDVTTAVSGYKVGTILEMTDGTGFWLNVVDGNTFDPDAGGLGWVPLIAYGVTSIGTGGGTVNFNPLQARYPVIVLTGTLTSNLVLNLPNRLGTWLIANGTSGAFTTTAKTTSGSIGVTIPQGGLGSPTGVYCVADGNIYPTVSPLSVPIDQAATPLTLAERTNTGNILANYFLSESGLEVPDVGAVLVQNTAADGVLRKIPFEDFVSQLVSQTIGPSQYSITLPGGLILKVGYSQGPGVSPARVGVIFTNPFPSNILGALCSTLRSTAGSSGSNFVSGLSKTGMTCVFDALDGQVNVQNGGYWIAIGN